jgi:hypothetical protein
MIARRVARAVCLALFAAASTTSASPGCGVPSPLPTLSAPRHSAALPSLYVFDAGGRLYRTGFDQRPWQLVRDTGIRDGIEASISRSTRWIVYRRESSQEMHIVDTRDGSDRPVALPGAIDATPVFSPDSRTLATYVHTGFPGSGLVLVDLESGRITHAGTAATHSIYLPSMQWSKDSRSLYLAFAGRGWLLYRYDPNRGRFSPAFGRQETVERDAEFYRFGRRVEMDSGPIKQSMRLARAEASPDGWMTAKIGKDHVLQVRAKGGTAVSVAKGGYSQCMGTTIFVRGWVAGHKMLVFALDDVDYVYWTESGRTTRLLSDTAGAQRFLW